MSKITTRIETNNRVRHLEYSHSRHHAQNVSYYFYFGVHAIIYVRNYDIVNFVNVISAFYFLSFKVELWP